MKKVFVVWGSLMLSSSLFAINNVNMQTKYQEAMKSYKSKDFAQSYQLFSQLYITKLSDAKLNFYLGRSAFETGHYAMALAAFERVDMLDPSNLRNRLEMGRTYFMLGMHEEAQKVFEEVLQNQEIPKNVRKNIELYLAKVVSTQKKSFTSVSFDLDILYDSNVNYGSLNDKYSIYSGTLPSEKVHADIAWQLYGGLVNVYDIGESGGFGIKNRFSGFIKDYKSENDYNIKYIGYTPSLVYSQNKILTEFSLSIDSLTLASHEYLRTFSIIPQFSYKHSSTLESVFYLKYQNKKFRESINKGLDAHHYEISYSLEKILTPRSSIVGNFVALQERKKAGKRIDVDYKEYRSLISYRKNFTSLIGSEFFGEYRRRHYDHFSKLFGTTRMDNAGRIGISLQVKAKNNLSVNLKGMYDKVHSNQERFSYKKYILSLGITKKF